MEIISFIVINTETCLIGFFPQVWKRHAPHPWKGNKHCPQTLHCLAKRLDEVRQGSDLMNKHLFNSAYFSFFTRDCGEVDVFHSVLKMYIYIYMWLSTHSSGISTEEGKVSHMD